MNKGLSFFRRTHVCLPSAEAFCWRPNYAAYPGLLCEADRVPVWGRAGLCRGRESMLGTWWGGFSPRTRPNFAGGCSSPDRCEKSPPYLRAHDFWLV